MKEHHFRSETFLPAPVKTVFAFFSKAENLQKLTPPWLDFKILTPLPIEMQGGTRIEYRLKLRYLPMRWLTEISAWEPPVRFVDRQLRGPYALWVHEHRFEAAPDGTTMFDHVRYALPWGMLGTVAHKLFVRRDVERIFQYRQQAIQAIFQPAPPTL